MERGVIPTLADVFFFFQAEDGIRDLTVTGVQTCALPISHGRGGGRRGGSRRRSRLPRLPESVNARFKFLSGARAGAVELRSEERRVGKEWRSRWSPYHLKKKIDIFNLDSLV